MPLTIHRDIEHIRYLNLPENYYSHHNNNSLFRKRLENQSDFAKNLNEPSIFGKFASYSDYLRSLELLLNSTLETEHRCEFFKRKVYPIDCEGDQCLEVGPGTGILTKYLLDKFKHLTLVDKNKESLDLINQWKQPQNTTIKMINESILNVKLQPGFYNMAVISHVLYYINCKKWLDVIKNMFQALDSGGVLFIVMNEGLDKSKLIKHFGGKDLEIDSLINECMEQINASFDLFASEESYYSLGITAMLHIAGLHLFDVGAVANKKRLIEFIDKHCRVRDDFFQLKVNQKFILLYK